MGVNKIIYAGAVLIDLTLDTVAPEKLAAGITATDKTGKKITGTMSAPFTLEYKSTATTASSTVTVPIGITDYVPQEDLLYIYVNGMMQAPSTYTVTGTGKAAAATFTAALPAGAAVECRVIKFQHGNVSTASGEKLLAVDDNGTVLTDGAIALKTF